LAGKIESYREKYEKSVTRLAPSVPSQAGTQERFAEDARAMAGAFRVVFVVAARSSSRLPPLLQGIDRLCRSVGRRD